MKLDSSASYYTCISHFSFRNIHAIPLRKKETKKKMASNNRKTREKKKKKNKKKKKKEKKKTTSFKKGKGLRKEDNVMNDYYVDEE